MSSKPRTSDAVQRPQSPTHPMRRVSQDVRGRPIRNDEAGLLDCVRDQHDKLWFRYGIREQAAWVLVADLVRPDAITRLINLDPRLIDPAAQKKLRSAVAHTHTFRPALVAASPGWIGHQFVLGEGNVLQRSPKTGEVIVAFQPDQKFAPRGQLVEWQAALGPLTKRQPLVLFALALAFVGPILPFVPPDYLSPLFEIVGAPGSGKSTLGVVAMSVWAGDRESGSGGGETWNLTPGRFDDVKLGHRHALLLLDEANLAGATLEARRQLIQHAVFSLTNTGARQRLGDPPNKPHAQLAVLSTSNRRLSELIEGSTAERGAVHERMITILIAEERAHGVLNHVPPAYTSSAQAVEALRAAADEQWGTAGPAFVRALQREIARDEERLRSILGRALAHHRESLSRITDLPRVQKSLALVMVAGALARRWGILPKEWGCPAKAVRSIAEEALQGVPPAAVGAWPRVCAYVEQHQPKFCEVVSLSRPLAVADFEAKPGFIRRFGGRTELLIPAQQFQAVFSDYRQIMSELRLSGQARTEHGQQPKLTIKTPRAICNEGRVYCIVLSP